MSQYSGIWSRQGDKALAPIYLSTPEKPDIHSVPCTVPSTDSLSAVKFNKFRPSSNLPAKVRMKGDTVQVQTVQYILWKHMFVH